MIVIIILVDISKKTRPLQELFADVEVFIKKYCSITTAEATRYDT